MMAMDALSRARLQRRQLLRHQRQPAGLQGLPRRAHHPLAARRRGYFGAGSGVAWQEQFHSARGLVKAFRETRLAVPAVMRFGGNGEEMAIEILTSYAGSWRAGSATARTAVDVCAARLNELDRGVLRCRRPRPPRPRAARSA